MAEPARLTVRKGDTVAVRDAFDEWHPAIAETGVVTKGVRFPLVRCALVLRGLAVVPFPVEDVRLLTATSLSRVSTLADLLGDPPQPDATVRVPFQADHQGERVTVTAVLDRTAVFYRPGARAGEGVLVGHGKLVPAEELVWVPPDPNGRPASAWRGRKVALQNRELRFGSNRDEHPRRRRIEQQQPGY